MNKTELASKLATKLKVSKADGLLLVDAVFAEMLTELKTGRAVKLQDVGRFYIGK